MIEGERGGKDEVNASSETIIYGKTCALERERMWEEWRWLGHPIWSGAEGPRFCGNEMGALFP